MQYRDGSVRSFGAAAYGGRMSPFLLGLRDGVARVFGNAASFVALRADGTIATWGDRDDGGRMPELSANKGVVTDVVSTPRAYAVLHETGAISTWGNVERGGSMLPSMEDEINEAGAERIFSNAGAFTVLTRDGDLWTLWTWGDRDFGGSEYPEGLSVPPIRDVATSERAFAAVLVDGNLRYWGNRSYGGAGPSSSSATANFAEIAATDKAFAARTEDGRIVAWGDADSGGHLDNQSSGFRAVSLHANAGAFVAIGDDGSILCWGSALGGGDCEHLGETVLGHGGVVRIESTDSAFAAVARNGRVIAWGDPRGGGQAPGEVSGVPVAEVVSTSAAFAAIVAGERRIIAWGDQEAGGMIEDTTLPGLQGNVTALYASEYAFLATHSCAGPPEPYRGGGGPGEIPDGQEGTIKGSAFILGIVLTALMLFFICVFFGLVGRKVRFTVFQVLERRKQRRLRSLESTGLELGPMGMSGYVQGEEWTEPPTWHYYSHSSRGVAFASPVPDHRRGLDSIPAAPVVLTQGYVGSSVVVEA